MEFLTQLLTTSLPVLVAGLVGVVKKGLPKVPKVLYPLLAVGLGTGASVLTDKTATAGALAGLAAIGVREVADQLIKSLFPST